MGAQNVQAHIVFLETETHQCDYSFNKNVDNTGGLRIRVGSTHSCLQAPALPFKKGPFLKLVKISKELKLCHMKSTLGISWEELILFIWVSSGFLQRWGMC